MNLQSATDIGFLRRAAPLSARGVRAEVRGLSPGAARGRAAPGASLRRLVFFAALLAMAPAPAPAPFPGGGSRAEVVLVPLGEVPSELLDAVSSALVRHLQVQVRRAEPLPLPASAYYEPRQRYRAERLLRYLARLPEARGRARILGLTEVDISTTRGRHPDWGIFGYASIGGRSAVLSSHRLRTSARDREHLEARVATVAVHEVGHVLGLHHCPTPRCIMADAKGSVRPVDAATELCPRCLIRLARLAPFAPAAR